MSIARGPHSVTFGKFTIEKAANLPEVFLHFFGTSRNCWDSNLQWAKKASIYVFTVYISLIKKENNTHFLVHDSIFIITFQLLLHVFALFPVVIMYCP